MKNTDAVKHFVEQWRALRAWGRPMDEVKILYRQRSSQVGNYSTGRCYPVLRRVVVTVAPDDVPMSLSTGLHELAHAAAPADVHHGDWWRRLYAGAVEEVTGRPIYEAADLSLGDFKRVATDTLAAWWREQPLGQIWKFVAERKPGGR